MVGIAVGAVLCAGFHPGYYSTGHLLLLVQFMDSQGNQMEQVQYPLWHAGYWQSVKIWIYALPASTKKAANDFGAFCFQANKHLQVLRESGWLKCVLSKLQTKLFSQIRTLIELWKNKKTFETTWIRKFARSYSWVQRWWNSEVKCTVSHLPWGNKIWLFFLWLVLFLYPAIVFYTLEINQNNIFVMNNVVYEYLVECNVCSDLLQK